MLRSTLSILTPCCCLQGCLLFSTPESGGGGDAPPVDVSVVMVDGSEDQGNAQEPIDDMQALDMDRATPEDLGSDLSEDLSPMPVTPPGWWDGAWTMRHTLEVKIDWPSEVVLPVRLSGGISAHRGEELVLFLNDALEPLSHETEKWSAATENVVWVRFPDGLEAGDQITIYSHTDTPPDPPTARPGAVWRDLARHVYHFDDRDPSLSRDSVEQGPIHLLKSGGYTAGLPSSKMGRHLTLTQDTPNIFSNGTVSPLHMADDQDTTFEVHFSLPAFLDDGAHRIISEENACHGTSLIIGPDVSFTRLALGEGCEAEGFPRHVGAQTVLHNTYQLDTEYLLFAVFDWSDMTGLTFINERNERSNTLTIPRYTSGTRAIPKRMDVGGAPWHDKQVPLTIDTLIIHDRAISRDEVRLRQQLTHDNASAFELTQSESIEDFIAR